MPEFPTYLDQSDLAADLPLKADSPNPFAAVSDHFSDRLSGVQALKQFATNDDTLNTLRGIAAPQPPAPPEQSGPQYAPPAASTPSSSTPAATALGNAGSSTLDILRSIGSGLKDFAVNSPDVSLPEPTVPPEINLSGRGEPRPISPDEMNNAPPITNAEFMQQAVVPGNGLVSEFLNKSSEPFAAAMSPAADAPASQRALGALGVAGTAMFPAATLGANAAGSLAHAATGNEDVGNAAELLTYALSPGGAINEGAKYLSDPTILNKLKLAGVSSAGVIAAEQKYRETGDLAQAVGAGLNASNIAVIPAEISGAIAKHAPGLLRSVGDTNVPGAGAIRREGYAPSDIADIPVAPGDARKVAVYLPNKGEWLDSTGEATHGDVLRRSGEPTETGNEVRVEFIGGEKAQDGGFVNIRVGDANARSPQVERNALIRGIDATKTRLGEDAKKWIFSTDSAVYPENRINYADLADGGKNQDWQQLGINPVAGQGALRGAGAVVGGIAGHQLDDPNDPANQLTLPDGSPNPDYNPILANRGLIGGAMLGGTIAGSGIVNKALFSAMGKPNEMGLFSNLERAAQQKIQGPMTADQLRKTLENTPGVKREEIKWVLGDLLNRAASDNRKITPEELASALEANKVQVSEVTKGSSRDAADVPFTERDVGGRSFWITDNSSGTGRFNGQVHQITNTDGTVIPDRYHAYIYDRTRDDFRSSKIFTSLEEAKQWVASKPELQNTPTRYGLADYSGEQLELPGGKNYRELLLTVPESRDFTPEYRAAMEDYMVGRASAPPPNTNFQSNHWEEPNVLAHIRFNDRITPDGKKVLFIEEIQSDWAQKARQEGLDKVLQAPFVASENGTPGKLMTQTWPELAMKRMVIWAAEHGYDEVAWTTGKQQEERYRLSQHFDQVSYNPNSGALIAVPTDTMQGRHLGNFTPEELPSKVGPDLAAKLLAPPPAGVDAQVVNGANLDMGGEFHKLLYDQQMPSIANNLGKRFGQQVRDINVGADNPNNLKVLASSDGWRIMGDNEYGLSKEYGGPYATESLARQEMAKLSKNDITAHAIAVPDFMRQKVKEEGFPLFVNPGTGETPDYPAMLNATKKRGPATAEELEARMAQTSRGAKGMVNRFLTENPVERPVETPRELPPEPPSEAYRSNDSDFAPEQPASQPPPRLGVSGAGAPENRATVATHGTNILAGDDNSWSQMQQQVRQAAAERNAFYAEARQLNTPIGLIGLRAQDVDPLQVAMSWHPGQPLASHELLALAHYQADSEPAIALMETRKLRGDTSVIPQLERAKQQYDEISQVLSGASAEAGRGLRVLREVFGPSFGGSMGKKNFTPQLAAEITSHLNAVYGAATPDMVEVIRKLLPEPEQKTLATYFQQYVVGQLLGNPAIWLKKYAGDQIEAGAAVLDRANAAVANSATSLFGANRVATYGDVGREIEGQWQARGAAASAALGQMKQMVTTGNAFDRVTKAGVAPLSSVTTYFDILGETAEKNVRAYQVARQLGLSGAAAEAKAGRIAANPIAELGNDAGTAFMRAVRAQGQTRTFTEPLDKFGRMIGEERSIPFIGPMFAPVFRTPYNIAKRTLGRLGGDLIGAAVEAKRGNDIDAYRNVGKVMTAAEVVGVSLSAIALGGMEITGAAPTDVRAKELWDRQGKTAYSVKLGDRWYRYNTLGPLGHAVGDVATIIDSFKNMGQAPSQEHAWRLVQFVAANMADTGFLDGLNTIVDAAYDPSSIGQDAARQAIGGLSLVLPGGPQAAQIERMTDPYKRQVSTDYLHKPVDAVLEKVMSQYPGLAGFLNPQIDAYGQPVENRSTGIINAINPVRSSRATDPSFVDRELIRLSQRLGSPVGPTDIGPNYKIASYVNRYGTPRTLTAGQLSKMRNLASRMTRAELMDTMSSSEYALALPLQRKAMIQTAIGKAHSDAADIVVPKEMREAAKFRT